MSKASDWANSDKGPAWSSASGTEASVDDDGDLEIDDGHHVVVVGKKEALPLARWILDTFGEP